MIEIVDADGLNEFLKQERAALFFDAPWSEYCAISKQMVRFIERYAEMGTLRIHFCSGVIGDRILLANQLLALGVPENVFLGHGSLSFFEKGRHVSTLDSVIGEGTRAVWKQIESAFGVRRGGL